MRTKPPATANPSAPVNILSFPTCYVCAHAGPIIAANIARNPALNRKTEALKRLAIVFLRGCQQSKTYLM
jgi:hypothetical protein